MQKKYHLIAIGGSVMHNVALDLAAMGHKISGSDDEIYEPSRSRLARHKILPDKMGWDASRITADLDAVILGKHARSDNPELLRAQELGLAIYSFPEFISDNSRASTRICIAGSHGKTSTTGILMHVFKQKSLDFDYLVGAQLEGFDRMVKLSSAPLLLVEGDEYPSSAVDNRAKMLHYKANISVITGLAWDHINIYKTYEDYVDVFREFLRSMSEDAVCFFDRTDKILNQMMIKESFPPSRIAYWPLALSRKNEIMYGDKLYPVQLFGQHNMSNMHAALKVCQHLGIPQNDFFESLQNYSGADKRLQLVETNSALIVYRDFAHAPSKCKASVSAIRGKFRDKRIKAVLELHTYSSLNIEFIEQYAGTMAAADEAIIYFDKNALSIKRMPELDIEQVARAFAHEQLKVLNDPGELETSMTDSIKDGTDVLLIMSSGNLGGIKPSQLFQ